MTATLKCSATFVLSSVGFARDALARTRVFLIPCAILAYCLPSIFVNNAEHHSKEHSGDVIGDGDAFKTRPRQCFTVSVSITIMLHLLKFSR